jgi:hypothetical protein
VIKRLKYFVALTILFASLNGISQSHTDTLASVMRPRIGLGVGTMTYYGEIQNYQKKFVPTVNRYYGLAYVNLPVTPYFNMEFTASYGKVAANERTLERNLNFESRIRMASVQLYYNFYPLFSKKRSLFHPYVGVGFSSFEFLSKTDMYDASGTQQYFYWSDGSIMSLDESDPLASTAVPVQRDYTYETDLREQNLDSLGKYKEQSFGIPLSIGSEWHLSPRFDFRIATTYHLTFTDLIDNISPAGQGPQRHGDGKKDKLWTTYISLSYDLMFAKEKPFDPLDDSNIELYAEFEMNDTDEDGVIDAYDECAATPPEAMVDDKGCPLDRDNDGVPDYKDDEMETPEGNYVDENGVTITEEDIAQHWKEFNDSTGYDHQFAEEKTTVEFGKKNNFKFVDPYAEKPEQSYVVIIGKEHKDLSEEEMHKYLGFDDFKTETRGDTVFYILGEYPTIEEAVNRKSELEEMGIDVELIGRNGSNQEVYVPVTHEVVEKVAKINGINGNIGLSNESPDQVFRVQLGAFKKKVNEETAFPGLDVIHATSSDGVTRYYSGKYNDYEGASKHRLELISKGYRSAFVVAYQGTERVTLHDAGVQPNNLPDNYNQDSELNSFTQEDKEGANGSNTTDTNNSDIINGIDMSKVEYKVRLGHYTGDVPIDDINIYYSIGGVKPHKTRNGETSYFSKPFKSKEDAETAISDYTTYGLSDLVPYVYYEGEYFTIEEFDAKLKP